MSRPSISAVVPHEQPFYVGVRIGPSRGHTRAQTFANHRPILFFVLAATIWTVPIVMLACIDARALMVYLPNALLRGDFLFLLCSGGSLVYLLASTWLLAAAATRLAPSWSRPLRWALQLAVAPAILASLIATIVLTFALSFAVVVRSFPALL